MGIIETMNNANNRDLLTFEMDLQIGEIVEARWTNGGSYYRAQAKVVKINSKTFRVELLETVPTFHGHYPTGYKISCPSIIAPRWSDSNRICPVAPATGADAHTNYVAALGL